MGKVVSPAEFENDVSRLTEMARDEPITIGNSGEEQVVLVSADEYRRLKLLDRQVLYAWELDESTLRHIAKSEIPSEAAEFDHELG